MQISAQEDGDGGLELVGDGDGVDGGFVMSLVGVGDGRGGISTASV